MLDTHDDIRIFDMTSSGAGVGKLPDDRRVFISGGVWVGDTVSIKVTKNKKRYAIANLVKILSPSKLRAKPICSLHGHTPTDCGGCDWMHANYESQLAMKESIVRFALRANSIDIDPERIRPSPKAYGYRGRARLHFDGDSLGFYGAESKNIVDVSSCPVLSAKAASQLTDARKHLFSVSAGKQKPREVFLDDKQTLFGKDFLTPAIFRQANQNNFLRKAVGQLLQDTSPKNILELFAGTGNLTSALHISGDTKITCADLKACESGFKKAYPDIRFVGLDLFQGWKSLLKLDEAKNWDALVIDPPRSGWSELANFCASSASIRSLVYVSCNPNSFAKDVKPLVASDWELKSVQPVDMMPQTSHVELVGFLKRES